MDDKLPLLAARRHLSNTDFSAGEHDDPRGPAG
jgi:hypothetical protein